MNNNVDKQIEKLIDKTMKHTELESPSFNFTNAVMSQVHALEQSAVTTYKPLISKPMWFAIFAVGLAIVLYIVLGTSTTETSWLSFIDLSVLTNNKFSIALPEFTISKTVMYAVVLFGLMLFIQIPILKNYFDKRIAV